MKPKDITAAATAFVQATQGDVVPDSVIASRARVCRQCPVRTKSILAGVIAKALDKAPQELKNYRCGICKCPLGLLIPAKQPHEDSEKERKKREAGNKHCWMLRL